MTLMLRTYYRQHGSFAGPNRNVRIADKPDATWENGLDERFGLLTTFI
jgi:hypothetical protein